MAKGLNGSDIDVKKNKYFLFLDVEFWPIRVIQVSGRESLEISVSNLRR